MLLLHILNFYEETAGKTNISFRTEHYQGEFLLDSGIIVRIKGFDISNIKSVLDEKPFEVSIKKMESDLCTETNLAIRSLALEAAVYLDEKKQRQFTDTASVNQSTALSILINGAEKKGDLSSGASGTWEKEKSELKPPPRRKTLNVDASHRVAHIMLPFIIGKPEKKILGRSDQCDIVVDSVDVSRQHCEVTFSGNSLFVKDLQSSNGTFINGKQVTESDASSHDVLRLGSVPFILIFEAKI
jgi:FHA domain